MGDLAGGTRQPFFGWADFVQVIAVVVEPSAKPLLAARRLAGLGGTVDGATVGLERLGSRGANVAASEGRR